MNGLFYYLLRAPTAAGRAVMDQIEGLELYIRTAESNRLNLAGAPDLNATQFERILPYAVALNAEKPWSEAFSTAFARANPGQDVATAYSPAWHGGSGWSGASFAQLHLVGRVVGRKLLRQLDPGAVVLLVRLLRRRRRFGRRRRRRRRRRLVRTGLLDDSESGSKPQLQRPRRRATHGGGRGTCGSHRAVPPSRASTGADPHATDDRLLRRLSNLRPPASPSR